MSLSADLRAYLLEDTALAALIGTRLYPEVLPQAPTLPAVTFGPAGGERFYHLTGASGVAGPRYQFDAWGATFLDAEAVFEALRGALSAFRGEIGGSPPTRRIQGAFCINEWGGYEDGADAGSGSGAGLYRRSADFAIYHEEG